MQVIPINQVSQHFHAPASSHPTVLKMESFQNLPHGWHYGEGGPCAPSVLEQAIRLHQEIINLGFSTTDAFPGVDGGMLLAAYEGAEYFTFRLEVDGSITYYRETQDVEVDEQERLTWAQALAILRTYRAGTWTPSDSYISDTMISIGNASVPKPMLLTAIPFRLWMPAALSV